MLNLIILILNFSIITTLIISRFSKTNCIKIFYKENSTLVWIINILNLIVMLVILNESFFHLNAIPYTTMILKVAFGIGLMIIGRFHQILSKLNKFDNSKSLKYKVYGVYSVSVFYFYDLISSMTPLPNMY